MNVKNLANDVPRLIYNDSLRGTFFPYIQQYGRGFNWHVRNSTEWTKGQWTIQVEQQALFSAPSDSKRDFSGLKNCIQKLEIAHNSGSKPRMN